MIIKDDDYLNQAIENGPDHLRPFFMAVRDQGCTLQIVMQHIGRFVPPPSPGPTITLIGDDFDEALGPSAFDRHSLGGIIRGSRAAAVVSSEAIVEPYLAMASEAVLLRNNVMLVETQPEQEIQWVNLLREINPGLRILLSSVRGGSA